LKRNLFWLICSSDLFHNGQQPKTIKQQKLFFCNSDKHYYVDAVFSSWGTWNRLQDLTPIDPALIDPIESEECFQGFVLTWNPREEKFGCKSSEIHLDAICYALPIVGD
jgi:hypothetical protein